MKKLFIYTMMILFIPILILSCGSKRSSSGNSTKIQAVDTYTPRNSINYTGTYEGVLPCADCEGIRTELTLNKETYILKTTYLGVHNPAPFVSEGKYSWNKEGNVITLNSEESPNQYQVGENVIYHLDMDGKRITGANASNYILRKK